MTYHYPPKKMLTDAKSLGKWLRTAMNIMVKETFLSLWGDPNEKHVGKCREQSING